MAQTSRLVLEIDSRDAEQKAADTRKALEALEGAGLRAKPAMDKLADGIDEVGQSSQATTRRVKTQREELEELLGAIDPVTRRLGELDKQEKELAKNRKLGLIDTETFNEYQGKISATRAELGRFNADMNKTGMSAKATAAALRSVPAQFTDIAVSLQGGQAPLTVFLQQGGQLKDMFGGAVPAAKALSSYVIGLVNPLTLAGSAVAALGVAYYQGSKEADVFRVSLVSTGNAAGTTTSSLATMAKSISTSVGTTGQASAALSLLAGSGKIASDQFEMIARSAISFEKATGKAVSETVAEFAKIADDPVKALGELNDKYNFLTASVYEQVRALQEQGNKQGAAAVADQAYAKALEDRSAKIKASLGDIEAAWNGITSVAKKAWDAMLDVGRPSTLDDQIANTQKLLDERRNSFTAKIFSGSLGEDSNSTKFLKERLALLTKQRDLSITQAKQEGDNARTQREGQKAFEEFQKSIEANFTKRQKMNKALEDEEKRIAKAREAGYSISKAQEEAALKSIRENSVYKEATPKKVRAYTEDAGVKALDAARQTYAVLVEQNAGLNTQGILTEKVGVQAQALIKWEQQLADIKTKKTLTADQKALLASEDLITAQLKRNAAIEAEGQALKSVLQAQKDQVQLLTLTGQLREANSLKSSLDDAAQLAEYERQGNVEAAKRLEVMIKIRDINLKSAQKYGTVEGVSQAPTAPGIDASVGGASSEIDRLDEAAAKLDEWRATELEKQKAYLDLKAVSEETYAARVANIDEQAQAQRVKIEQAKNQALLSGASTFFGSMVTLSQSQNAKLAAIGKAAAITQATIDGYVAVQKALAAFPPPFNFVAAAAVGVATAANVANIAGVGFSQGGYTGSGGVNEPAGVVHKGEVVWSQSDIRKFGGVASVEALRNGNVSPVRNAEDSGAVRGGYAPGESPRGDRPVMVTLVEDASKAGKVERSSDPSGDNIRAFVSDIYSDGESAQALKRAFGLKRVGE